MDPYTRLARRTVETFARTGQTIAAPPDLPAEFYSCRQGVFVTIFTVQSARCELRGCVGTFAPTRENLAEEIIQNAIWASREDERFRPVAADELDRLRYEVSLLAAPQPIEALDQLEPSRYGLIVRTTDGRCGLLLPGLEGVDTASRQLAIAARKGRIDPEREEVSLWRFTVTKFSEQDE